MQQPRLLCSLLLTVLFSSLSPTLAQPSRQCTSSVNLRGLNPFVNRTLFSHKRWRDEALAGANAIADPGRREKAMKVASEGTFLWLDSTSRVNALDEALAETPCGSILGVVLHNLPGRQVNDEAIPSESIETYKTTFIDKIRPILQSYPNVAVALIIEPWVLASIHFYGPGGSRCPRCGFGWRDGIVHALDKLGRFENVAVYLDGANGMEAGSDLAKDGDRLNTYAALLSQVYMEASSPPSVRGFSVNIAGYNGWRQNPGEFVPACFASTNPNLDVEVTDCQYNKAQDESRFVALLSKALNATGVAGLENWRAIMDTSRNGVLGLRSNWTASCNVNGAGLGVRPRALKSGEDADAPGKTDAFVWVKSPGESDGTSNTTSEYFDTTCGLPEAVKPSPDYGRWNQKHFEMLVENAEPQL